MPSNDASPPPALIAMTNPLSVPPPELEELELDLLEIDELEDDIDELEEGVEESGEDVDKLDELELGSFGAPHALTNTTVEQNNRNLFKARIGPTLDPTLATATFFRLL